jgi:hypothetical protein
MQDATTFLMIEAGPAAGSRIQLTEAGLSIGRQPGNDLVIPDGELSRHHARIDFRDGVAMVTDLGSANGTTVNGYPVVAPHPLNPGDVILLGDTALRFEAETGVGAWPAPFAPSLSVPPIPLPQTFAPISAPSMPPAPPPARSTNRLPLVIGAVVAAFLVLCLCGGGGVALLVNGDDQETENGGSASQSGGSGADGGDSLPQGNYRCGYFAGQATGYITSGGIHILSGGRVTYSTDGKSVSGAQQYRYTYDASTLQVSFQGGPYEGKAAEYDPGEEEINIGFTNCERQS